jgi:large subunit ribosomal protein L10
MLKTEKPAQVKKIKELTDKHEVVGVLNMHKMPAKQLQQMRESLRGKAVIKMAKKSIIKRALEDKKELQEKLDGKKVEPALLFSNENPFRLYKILKESRTPAAAKPGDIATKDIVITKGPTPLPPGPAISTLQKVGLKSSVQGGKIAVMQDKVVCKIGDTVSDDLASVLNLLKIEPMEIGLDLMVVYENGVIYGKSVLDVDQQEYLANLRCAVQHAVNLSLNTGYITKFTADLAVQKAFMEARTLCIDANITEKDFIDEVLKKAAREAMALKAAGNIE